MRYYTTHIQCITDTIGHYHPPISLVNKVSIGVGRKNNVKHFNANTLTVPIASETTSCKLEASNQLVL